MSKVGSSLPVFALDEKPPSNFRPIAEFPPSVWGDYFLSYASSSEELDQDIETQIKMLKEEVSKILVSKTEEPLAKIDLIDSICRLGVNYHFGNEIDEVLQQIHKNYVVNGEIIVQSNLCSLALLFRILRQHGFYVSPLVFENFKDEQGNFGEKLVTDVEGMLCLYEASHMMVHGEDILEEALAFTSTHLDSIVTQLTPSLAAQVKHSLRQPLYKNLPRLEARHYISIYEQDPSHNELLLTLAKLDFNKLQNLHKKEFGNIYKWWKELDLPSKLPYARDRIIECCFWALAVYFEPHYSQARKIVAKVLAIAAAIDDTYDAYGTIEELELFTEAIERWDISCLDDLPEYMKFIYKSTIRLHEEIEQEMKKEGRAYCVKYAIKEFKMLVQAYMSEARWLKNNYKPTTEEYLHASLETSGYSFMTTLSYIGMGDTATENIFKWVRNEPKIVKGSCIIARLMDDIVSNEFEQKRGHVSSFLECYMSEYGVSREVAIQKCQKAITNAWKDINEECLKPTSVPMPFLTRILNLSRFMNVFYKDKDNFTHSGGLMKKCIKALLIDPVPI
ncbi:probable terpene synthase 2 [Cajanus cajan]|uniref:probable terpene synthase 2 n=1 Tax=Cajanus cajan TaxID=3821 RepID=UPI00098DBD50|nr:probable terpene synthase 2 [Cajanus cajan]